MRFTVNLNGTKHTFDRPLHKEERRSLGLEIKRALFPGKSYRVAKERGAAALGLAFA